MRKSANLKLKSPNFNQKTFLNMNIHSTYNFHTAISDILGNLYPELSIHASLALTLAILFLLVQMAIQTV